MEFLWVYGRQGRAPNVDGKELLDSEELQRECLRKQEALGGGPTIGCCFLLEVPGGTWRCGWKRVMKANF